MTVKKKTTTTDPEDEFPFEKDDRDERFFLNRAQVNFSEKEWKRELNRWREEGERFVHFRCATDRWKKS